MPGFKGFGLLALPSPTHCTGDFNCSNSWMLEHERDLDIANIWDMRAVCLVKPRAPIGVKYLSNPMTPWWEQPAGKFGTLAGPFLGCSYHHTQALFLDKPTKPTHDACHFPGRRENPLLSSLCLFVVFLTSWRLPPPFPSFTWQAHEGNSTCTESLAPPADTVSPYS